uniref:Protein croquemort n=1 Tax=Lygus hesperus TaxID=30085 RepID=A0A0A9XHB3_LYGHE
MDNGHVTTRQNRKKRMTVPRVPVLIPVALIGCLGAIFVVSGITFLFTWNNLLVSIIKNQLKVTSGSKTYQMWRDTPVPQYMSFYFFNWTNHDKLKSETPTFDEVGPYKFNIVEKKTDVVYNENGTLTFRIQRFWYFDEENSYGSLDDEVYTLNAVAKTAANSIRNWNGLMRRSLSFTMGTFGTSIHVYKKVGELLFDGYSDPLLATASKMPAFSGLSVPFDKFGWFYKRNGSTAFDGLFNMDTGENGVENVGVLRRWNNKNTTGFYDGGCSMLKGSAGELFPPGVEKEKGIEMFTADLCRSIKLTYAEEVESYGLKGYKFEGDVYTFDNGTLDPANSCFCDGDCSPSGVLNLTACRFGAPGFVSFPHFHLADPFYREQVAGMHPDPQRHTLYITLEPTFGIPMDVAARFQINILLTPDDVISLFEDVPTIYFPMIWFEHRAGITPEMAAEVRLALAATTWNVYVALANGFLGAALLSWASYMLVKNRQRVGMSSRDGEEVKIGSLQNTYEHEKEVKEMQSLIATVD